MQNRKDSVDKLKEWHILVYPGEGVSNEETMRLWNMEVGIVQTFIEKGEIRKTSF